MKYPRGVKPLILPLSMILKKKNTVESKGIKYGKHERRSEIFLWGLASFSQTAQYFTSLQWEKIFIKSIQIGFY
jgi:hypothetical protein